MDFVNLIKTIIEKIKLWFKNLLKKKRKKTNAKSKYSQTNQPKKVIYNPNLSSTDENKGTIYPKLNPNNLQVLNKKGKILKNKVLKLENNKLNIQTIDNILESINKEELYINQAIKINHLLDNINNDYELNINTNEKLNILKDNISMIIDKKLDDYESSIIKKAYNEFDNVNYVIMTTLLIDDIIDEFNQINNDFLKNKYTLIEYEKKINKIKNKIDKLESINKRSEVTEELEGLRKDFYTKKKDKYDLLYNEEIFINLNNKCDELLNCIILKEKEQKIKVEFVETKKKEKVEKEKQEETKKQQEKKKKEEKEINDNILKRFIDTEFAHKLLLLRESKRKKLTTKEDFIKETLSSYNDFILGEHHDFNFERNRIKTEVAKLYNDITSTICAIEKKEFFPLEHINVKLDILTETTLDHQHILNHMIEQKHQYKIEEHETSKAVTSKLTNILNIEKSKDKEKEKVLKKEYSVAKKNETILKSKKEQE